MNRIAIGQRIASLRSRLNLSTQQLAERIGKSQATISRIENGKQGVNVELLARIAKTLKVHPFALLSESPLQHSILLPIKESGAKPGTGHSLSRLVENGRLRARLNLLDAAERLEIGTEELEAIELGYAAPDRDILLRMAEVYTLDGQYLLQLAEVAERFPEIGRRLDAIEQILGGISQALTKHSENLEHSPELRQLRQEVEDCLGLSYAPLSAERPAEYFSLGHVSDTLLEALQDREFHDQAEKLAVDFMRRRRAALESEPALKAKSAGATATNDSLPCPTDTPSFSLDNCPSEPRRNPSPLDYPPPPANPE